MHSNKEDKKKNVYKKSKDKDEDEKDINQNKIDEKIKEVEEKENSLKYELSSKLKELLELKKLKKTLKKKRDEKIQNSHEIKQRRKNNLHKDNSYVGKIEKDSIPKKIKEESNIQAKETKVIETDFKNNDSDCETKKCGIENVDFVKNKNVNVDDKFGGSCNMIDNGKNNIHETENNNRNCAVINNGNYAVNNNGDCSLNIQEKINEKKSNDGIASEKEKTRNDEEKKTQGNEKK